MDNCPWCNVPVFKESEENGITVYRCPKCGHGFVSQEFKVPVKALMFFALGKFYVSEFLNWCGRLLMSRRVGLHTMPSPSQPLPRARVQLECWGDSSGGIDYHDCISVNGTVFQMSFDRHEDSIPVFVATAYLGLGDYTVDRASCNGGYKCNFWKWQTVGNVSVSDLNNHPVTLTVSGDGTLRLYETLD